MKIEDVPDAANLIPKNLKIVFAHEVVGFGRSNRLKYAKHHGTARKPHGASQYALKERVCAMQSYLQFFNHFFVSITPINQDNFKDSYAQA